MQIATCAVHTYMHDHTSQSRMAMGGFSYANSLSVTRGERANPSHAIVHLGSDSIRRCSLKCVRDALHVTLSFGANRNVLLAHIRLLFEIYANFKTEKNVSESTRVASTRTDKKGKKKHNNWNIMQIMFSFSSFLTKNVPGIICCLPDSMGKLQSSIYNNIDGCCFSNPFRFCRSLLGVIVKATTHSGQPVG